LFLVHSEASIYISSGSYLHDEQVNAVAIWLDRMRWFWQHCRAKRYGLIWSAIRVPVAFLVAPLGAPIVIFLLLVPDLLQNPQSLPQNPIFTLLLGYSFVTAYLVTLSVGVWLFHVLRRLKLTQFWIAPSIGAILPVILISIIIEPPPASVIVLVSLPGAAVGAILWLIARPDRVSA
jgi:hypothetical protein